MNLNSQKIEELILHMCKVVLSSRNFIYNELGMYLGGQKLNRNSIGHLFMNLFCKYGFLIPVLGSLGDAEG